MPIQKIDEIEIVNRARKLFREKSYHATSMNDIATACGLQKGSLYHYFESKEELMEKVIEQVHLYFRQQIFKYAYDDKLSAQKKFSRCLKEAEKVFIHRENGRVYGNIGVETVLIEPHFQDSIRAFFRDFFLAIKAIYAEKYPLRQAHELAERSVAEIEGAIMLSRIFDDPGFLRRTNKRLIDRLN